MRRRLAVLSISLGVAAACHCARRQTEARPDPANLPVTSSASAMTSGVSVHPASSIVAVQGKGPWSDFKCTYGQGSLTDSDPCDGLRRALDSYETNVALYGAAVGAAPASQQCDEFLSCAGVEIAAADFALSLEHCFGPEWNERSLEWGRRWDRGRADAKVDGAIIDVIDPITCSVSHYQTTPTDCAVKFYCTFTDWFDERLHGKP